MENLAQSLFEAHQNPIVKLNTSSSNKIYLPKNTEEEKEKLCDNIGILKKTLSFPRVEKRCVRSLAIWLEKEHLARVIRKHYQHFGFQNKSGIYLYPEEALFLLETNRLEILLKDIPISIQQAYSLIIKDDILPLDKYRVYKKLAVQGYKISIIMSELSDTGEPKNKRIKLINENSDTPTNVSEEIIQRGCESSEEISKSLKDYKYTICSPRKKDFYTLSILENGELDPNVGLPNGVANNLYGIPLIDNVTFYQIGKVNIPDISKDDIM